MIEMNDIRSLTDFQRNAKAYTKRLSKSGRPMVLTVNGKAGAIVMGPAVYEELLKAWDLEQLREAIRQGERGEGVPAAKAFEKLRRKLGIPRRNHAKSK
ncbi:MAG TPA: type II toxin-antitoxin system Phd/YefM family antitoxin [Planctomycetota bacterium]|nr:type II toxin-antitoxin system Phd/YefM family antitoxin [Planctomycetota bacterium]